MYRPISIIIPVANKVLPGVEEGRDVNPLDWVTPVVGPSLLVAPVGGLSVLPVHGSAEVVTAVEAVAVVGCVLHVSTYKIKKL